MATFLTSDWHFGHDKDFVIKPRGFETVDEMNEAIFNRYQSVISDEDDVWVLGDLSLGDNEAFQYYFSQMKGKIHIIRGNHDTDTKIELYKTFPQVIEVVDAKFIKYGKFHIYLSHFPTLTGSLVTKSVTQTTINMYGHTHQQDNFFVDMYNMYHIGVDSHNCFPVPIEDALNDIREKYAEWKSQ